MNSRDQFARELLEDSKQSLANAKSATKEILKQRHLRHAVMTAFSFLELQVELISQHFDGNEFFSVHEQGVLRQRDVVLDKGVFKLKSTSKYSRIQDRMLLLQSKFKGSKLSQRAWWGPLLVATDRRNELVHPRAAVTLQASEVESDISAVLSCANDLFEIVFGKGLSYSVFGVKPKAQPTVT